MSHPLIDESNAAICSYEAGMEALRSRALSEDTRSETADIMGRTLITLEGKEHLQRRRLANQIVSRDCLQWLEQGAIQAVLERCLDDIELGPNGEAKGDLIPLSRLIFVRIAALTIGLDDVEDRERAEELLGLVQILNQAVSIRWSSRDHAVVMREAVAAKQALAERFFTPSFTRRQRRTEDAGYDAAVSFPMDLLSVLAAHPDPSWDDELPLRETIFFLGASTLNNVSLVARAVDELKGWFQHHPKDKQLMTDDSFLKAVVNETLRLHPPTPALFRSAADSVELRTGELIPAGGYAAIELPAINHDAKVFGDHAGLFDPRRDVPARVPRYGLAFGVGQHLCIGKPLVIGTSTTKGTLATVLETLYRAGLEPDASNPPRLDPNMPHRHSSYPVAFRNLPQALEWLRA